MKKILNSLKKLSLPIVLAVTLCIGGIVSFNFKDKLEQPVSAAFLPQSQLSNSLPEYFKIELPENDGASSVNYVDDTIYLFNATSYKDIIIGDDEITQGDDETNWYYSPAQNNNGQIYYYFDFTSSLSLYYGLTASEVQNGTTGENLLKNRSVDNYIFAKENHFTPSNTSLTPKKLDIKFKLNTSNEDISFGEEEQKNVITLNQEGIYTLALPVIEYRTTNGGETFESSNKDIYYNFLIFDGNTYFDNITGKPKISLSNNVQESNLTSSSYSTYYFYNFAYAGSEADKDTNTLPTITYNPNLFSISLLQTNTDSSTSRIFIEYQNNKLVLLNESGSEIPVNNSFIRMYIDEQNNANVVLSDIAVYDIDISYLYINESNGVMYGLDFDKLKNSISATADQTQTVVFKNKSQRLYIYGYQAMYSDYADIDSITNQPKSKDLKTYDDKNGYFNQADITSKVNNYVKNLSSIPDNPSLNTNLPAFKATLSSVNPSQDNVFSSSNLRDFALLAIKNKDIKPASTNQTPIKFLNNAKLDSDNSFILTYNNDTKKWSNTDNNSKFQGFNQNTPGTYLYIIQYTYDYFMSTAGILQSGYYHYQIFYFTITNTAPTVSVLDSNFNEVYTTGYTNKSVYILNDTNENAYDANVKITLTAYDYNNKTYRFQDVDIKNLASYNISYKKFNKVNEVSDTDKNFNKFVADKYGIFIENTSSIANSLFTINITSDNTSKGSFRTFTIDTAPIRNITSRNVSSLSSTTYKIGDPYSNYNSNQPFILSWDEKASGADTYGWISYIPLTEINYYSASQLSILLSSLIQNNVLPVSYKLDLKNYTNSKWTEYYNTKDFSEEINATYVKSRRGLYILEVYDKAGNSDFALYLIDDTSPIFLKEVRDNSTTISLFTNGEFISIPEKENTTVRIRWTKNKAILLENINSIMEMQPYQYGVDVAAAKTKLSSLLTKFFNTNEAENKNIINLNNIVTSPTGDAGISSYVGSYLKIPINNVSYIKEGNSDNFAPFSYTDTDANGYSYQVKFFDENGQVIADNKTYQILIRDASNTQLSAQADTDPSLPYRNYPSGYVAFNVVSDASKMMLLGYNPSSSKYEILNFASYSLEGNLYQYKEKEDDSTYVYTHLSNDGNGNNYTLTDGLQYKFSYYSPNKGNQPIRLSYIPLPANSNSKLKNITLKYYPYVVKYLPFDKEGENKDKNKYGDSNYYYYYDLQSTPSKTLTVFSLDSSDTTYERGDTLEFDIAIGEGNTPLAGKYVIERTYDDQSEVDKYDFFRRTLTIIIDNKNLITPLESVSNEARDASSLESIVGGDIVLSLYSGDNNSSIEVSFPSYNENFLSTGSFYSQDTYKEDDPIKSFAVSGNKLPISLNVPAYKFTEASVRSISSGNGAIYNNYQNSNLSYYGNAYYLSRANGNSVVYDVYVEDVLVQTFSREQQAKDFINTTAITEYKILVKVVYTLTEGNTIIKQKYYRSDGTTKNGFLLLYEASSENALPNKNALAENFFEKGNYEVTIYQASNLGSTNNFYSLYKFGFEIISQSPTFDVIGSDGNNLTETNTSNVFYTNSSSLRVQWELPINNFIAKIDENAIKIKDQYNLDVARSAITDERNSKYFTIDTERFLTIPNSYITITMRLEGYNSLYYNEVSKRIYFDITMPSQNLQDLMTQTQNATQNTFTKDYQLLHMREYYDYNSEEKVLSSAADISSASYSYTISNTNFQYYSYNVNPSFFNNTLLSTVVNAPSNPRETQFVYYRIVQDLNNYQQVDKASFSRGNYYQLTSRGTAVNGPLYCGFYEIVEMDYAGNMVVYLVQLTSSEVEDDANAKTNSLTYANSLHPDEDPVVVDESEISDGFNIYSTSGFTLKDINYKSDAWAYFLVKRADKIETRYMKSPWLDEGVVYKVSLLSTGPSFEQITLASLFEDVEVSSQKHRITLSDRISGEFSSIYISIMNASLITEKKEDPSRTSAILHITVPTASQVASTTTGYIFPVHIEIFQYSDLNDEKWVQIMEANPDPLVYGKWNPTEKYEGSSYISFKNFNSTTLRIEIYLGANATQKVRYEITDNFEKVTTVIQLANETIYKEISGPTNIYELPESNGYTTYLSSDRINYSYNTLLYAIKIYKNTTLTPENEITDSIPKDNPSPDMPISYTKNETTNVATYTFNPSKEFFYNDTYTIVVYDIEAANTTDEPIKTLYLKLYNMLPTRVSTDAEVTSGGIIFKDKNQNPIEEENIGRVPNYRVNFNGKTFVATADVITTFSNDVTLRFYNGQTLAYNGEYHYEDSYPYSVYLSSDNGTTWYNINSANSDGSGHRISGVGNYLILIKYDNETLFTDLCKIFSLSILDSSTNYYYITVDGLTVEKSDKKYTSKLTNKEYEINYIVSVDKDTESERLKITPNEELEVQLIGPVYDSTEGNVTVELWEYTCDESSGEFTIIYIKAERNILTTFSYETSTGTTNSIKDVSSMTIVANRETETNFDNLRINFSSYYGIEANKIKVEVTKLFNGSYVTINSKVYDDGENAFIILSSAGSYRLRVHDSCSPKNVHYFNNSRYFDIIFLSEVPFVVTNEISSTESITTEPIQNAVYNGTVIIKPTNLSTYYQASQMPVISVKRNGSEYNGYTLSNNTYTFTNAGYYTISFSAKSITGVFVRIKEFNFTILNKNESRYAYEFSQYDRYYIKGIEKDGVDITEDLLNIGNYPTTIVNDKKYLSGITINYLDEKTGGGKYKVTICPNNSELINTLGDGFTFEFWINVAIPPITVSIAEGDKTTDDISVSFNVQNLYNTVGDCYLLIADTTRYYTSDNLSSYGEVDTITILGNGTYYIQLYTLSGHLLYSYKVIKTEPLNVFAIIAIVIGCIGFVAIIIITIALRKRQKIK